MLTVVAAPACQSKEMVHSILAQRPTRMPLLPLKKHRLKDVSDPVQSTLSIHICPLPGAWEAHWIKHCILQTIDAWLSEENPLKSSSKLLNMLTTIPSKLCTHNSCIHIGEELRFNHDDNEKNQMGQEGHCSEQHQKNSTKRHHRRRFPIHHCGRFPLVLGTRMSHPSVAQSPPRPASWMKFWGQVKRLRVVSVPKQHSDEHLTWKWSEWKPRSFVGRTTNIFPRHRKASTVPRLPPCVRVFARVSSKNFWVRFLITKNLHEGSRRGRPRTHRTHVFDNRPLLFAQRTDHKAKPVIDVPPERWQDWKNGGMSESARVKLNSLDSWSAQLFLPSSVLFVWFSSGWHNWLPKRPDSCAPWCHVPVLLNRPRHSSIL